MLFPLIQFIDIIATGLVTGTVFFIWATERPRNMTGTFYTQLQHSRIAIASAVLPRLGGLTIVLTSVMAIFYDLHWVLRTMLAVAILCQLGTAFTTFAVNMPINRRILTWDPANPPANWLTTSLRWGAWHRLRTILMVVAFALLTASILLPTTMITLASH